MWGRKYTTKNLENISRFVECVWIVVSLLFLFCLCMFLFCSSFVSVLSLSVQCDPGLIKIVVFTYLLSKLELLLFFAHLTLYIPEMKQRI